MKRFLIPLLAALALPTAVNAEVVTYKCIAKYHFYINGEEKMQEKDQPINLFSFDLKNNMASTKYVGTVASQKNNDSNFSQEQFGLPVIITDASFIMDYYTAPKQKIIVEVDRIDKTYKQFHKYLRLDKKSPEFDKAFYENVRKNKELNFVLSNAGYKQWGDCEKIETRTNYSLPTEQRWSTESEFNIYEN